MPGRSTSGGPRSGHAIDPEVGSSSAATRCRRVDLPLPEGPTSAIRSAGRISKVASATAVTAAEPSPKTLVRPSARTSGSAIDHPPVAQADRSMGDGRDPVAVGDYHDGPTVIGTPAKERDYLGLGLGVDLAGRL